MWAHRLRVGEVTQPLLAVSGTHRRECLCHPEEKPLAAIRAGGDEWEFTGTVYATVEGHDVGEYTLDGVRPEEKVPSGSQTPNGVCLMRQPAKRPLPRSVPG